MDPTIATMFAFKRTGIVEVAEGLTGIGSF
jgi:hypothetical protein